MKVRNLLSILAVGLTLVACNSPTSVSSSTSTSTANTTATRFAAGTKAIKINTSILASGSFTSPALIPVATPIPALYPGSDGVSTYRPGVSATTYYDATGVNVVEKPTWLFDFQVGITNLPGTTGSCATFGGSTSGGDSTGFYRTSEINCGSVAGGTGNSLTDQAFVRIILNRDVAAIGSAENLMMQVEYQAQSLRLNSDGSNALPEKNLDQLWKIFWNNSLVSTSLANVFSVFVPPNYASCQPGGSGDITNPTATNCVSGYAGAPVTVKQILIPLSAYPTLSVIQLTRMGGRINNTDTYPGSGFPVNYVSHFLTSTGDTDCTTDSPLCLGVVIRSVMLMRL